MVEKSKKNRPQWVAGPSQSLSKTSEGYQLVFKKEGVSDLVSGVKKSQLQAQSAVHKAILELTLPEGDVSSSLQSEDLKALEEIGGEKDKP